MTALCPTCRQALPAGGGVLFDFNTNTVVGRGISVHLQPQEADVLAVLYEAMPRLVRHGHLLDRMYGLGRGDVDRDIIKTYVHRLRAKLAPTGVVIETLWGEGYRLAPPAAAA